MAITKEQSELSIIQAMLSGIGDLPIEDLDTDAALSDADVIKARALLADIMREEQNKSWWFNTETWEFTPDASGYVTLPSNMLKLLDTTYIERNGRLYDVENHTLVIDEDTVELEMVLLLDYDEVPFQFFTYIKALAVYEFFKQEDGDPQLVQGKQAEFVRASRKLEDDNLRFKAPNILTGNPTVRAIMAGYTNRRV